MKKLLIIIAFFILLFPKISNSNFDIDGVVEKIKKADSYVYDETGLLSNIETENINKKIEQISKDTTAEILVILINSTNGESISKLGVDIGQKVGVGKPDVDNGLVILISINDREWNISTGYGLEGILPDITTKKIGERNFPDNFRQDNYYKGIYESLVDLNGYLIQDESIISKYKNDINNINKDLIFIYFMIFMIIINTFIYKKNEKRKIRFKKFLIILIVSSSLITLIYLKLEMTPLTVNALMQFFYALMFDGNNGGGGSRRRRNSSFSSRGYGRLRSYSGGSFGGGGSRGKW